MSLDRQQQQAYLDAMGIQVWSARGAAPDGAAVALPEAPRLAQGPGEIVTLDWQALQAAVAGCTRCGLHRTRTHTVFGVGDPRARWLVIGEAPGAEEDRQGEPFVGRAGQLLDAMLKAVDLARGQVYIINILKCHPPDNRDPHGDEAAACAPYLRRQIELIGPSLILAVGHIAAQNLLHSDQPIGKLRGQVHRYGAAGIPLVATYHPAYLLRSPAEKRKAWQDLQLAQRTVQGMD